MSTPKRYVQVRTYTLPNGQHLRLHSAEWCQPCCRVKVHVDKFVEEKKLELLEEVEAEARQGLVIPFFELLDEKGEVVKSIQTSKLEELEPFLGL